MSWGGTIRTGALKEGRVLLWACLYYVRMCVATDRRIIGPRHSAPRILSRAGMSRDGHHIAPWYVLCQCCVPRVSLRLARVYVSTSSGLARKPIRDRDVHAQPALEQNK